MTDERILIAQRAIFGIDVSIVRSGELRAGLQTEMADV